MCAVLNADTKENCLVNHSTKGPNSLIITNQVGIVPLYSQTENRGQRMVGQRGHILEVRPQGLWCLFKRQNKSLRSNLLCLIYCVRVEEPGTKTSDCTHKAKSKNKAKINSKTHEKNNMMSG